MAMNKKTSLTLKFAEKIVHADPLSCSEAVMEAKCGLMDYIAVCFGAKRESGVSKLISIMQQQGGKEIVPIIGQNSKLSQWQAALVNGYSGHVLDFDDVHSDVRGHPSTVILPTLISVVSKENITGKQFLAAYIIGIEAMARLGEAIGSKHYLRGWHNTSTLGVIAAAVSAGYLKGFTAKQIAMLIGFATTQASGLRVHFGTETKPLHAGLAAQAAIMAVSFVENEISCSELSLDGELGFFGVYGQGSDFAETFLLKNWGETWKINKPGLWFKIYPFCSAAHHAADAAIELLSTYNFSQENIKEIIITFPPKGDAALIHQHPKNCSQGRFSVEYVVALVLAGQPLTMNNFRNIGIPINIQKLMKVTRRCYDASIKPTANAVPRGRFTIVQVLTKDEKSYSVRVDCPKGAPGNGVSLIELKEKMMNLVNCEELSEKLFSEITHLNSSENLKTLLTLL